MSASLSSSTYPTLQSKLSVAPMMDRTDRHCRYFLRKVSARTLLYTEMVTSQAILHGDLEKLLGFTPEEGPLVLQLGGDDPAKLAQCTRIAAEFGYDEINLNVGCPSARVQSGNFGACLMMEPERVADCVAAMRSASDLPVTVKHRIGVDEQDSYEQMARFVSIVAAAGCQRFTVHARKAWLKGLSPKENRDVPPLRYADVYRLKQEFPALVIEINGGILTLDETLAHLEQVDAVMIGRAATDNPYLFAEADQRIFGASEPVRSRHEIVESMYPYIDHWTSRGWKLHGLMRPMLQLFAGQPGSRVWKRTLTENASKPGAGVEVMQMALAQVPLVEG
ncbi:tRNA dihydrouridine(20/20a) synthase DusA [filamentous cyanobacterium LEGE 11480]|uniref:tRNA-dihydrouridine(20/20a) synthase n=1 Tax=Romeriopsis navalis LEGE 11480 TaxID=2777977 RepID=A0A928VR03_9CYAN|nr:tRNA dihydrouridine(20/20a) synthase DusA [Romeriopsis navalis]MBE9032910.1 tRNA dihydrouridine(20/20a) synthase DusA [Romeriopsis navalis LEGE 11480]